MQILLAPTASPKPDVDQRVESLIAKMTVKEKITLIGGVNDFFTRPIPRLGVPSLKMSDAHSVFMITD